MPKSLQPRYELKIEHQSVTASLKDEIRYEEEPDVVSTLTFTLSGRKHFIPNRTGGEGLSAARVVKLGSRVDFWGGTQDTNNYRKIFEGSIKTLRPVYDEKGKLKTICTAVGRTYTAAKNKVNCCYPTPEHPTRSWAVKDKIKLSDVVENIAKEMGMQVGEFKINGDDAEFTHKNPLVQHNRSDWGFLRETAKRYACNVWGEFVSENEGELLYFVDSSAQRSLVGEEIKGFLWPLRKEDGTYEYDRLREGEELFLSLEVDQDLDAADANVRTIQRIDPATGEDISLIQAREEDENGNTFVRYYRMEVDESKLPNDPDERERIKNIAYNLGGNSDYSFEDVKQYFVPAEFVNRDYEVIDKPWFGVTLNGTIEGNVNLKAKRSYPVRGVGRYSSDLLEDNYYLRTLRHVWSDEGFITEVELML